MNLLELLSASNSPTTGALASYLLRVTALAAAGHLGLFALRRAPAAARHLAATVTLAALVIAPLALALLPAWPALPLPIRAATWQETVTNSIRIPAPAARASRVPSLDRPTAASNAWGVTPAATRSIIPSSGNIGSDAALDPVRRENRWPSGSWPGAAGLLALVGTALLLLMRAVGSLRASWLAARGADCRDDGLLIEVARAARLVNLRRPVAVRMSGRLLVPVVVGPARPTLVLPEAFGSWPAPRRHAVLLHELAHVARRDGLALLVSRVATAIHWFHPLAWTLARIARHECERACDDVVLRSGVPATDYAGDLLAIAQQALRGSFPGASLAFVRRSSLEGRLIAILAADVRRAPATGRTVALASVAALLILLPLTSLRVAAAPRHRPAVEVPAATVVADRGDTELLASRITPSESGGASKENRFERTTRRRVTDPAMHLPPAGSKSGEGWYSAAREYYNGERWSLAGESYENAANAGYRTSTAWYNAACSYSLDGQRNRALGALGKALDEGFGSSSLVQSDSDLNALHSDPRFDLMLRGARDSEEDDKAQSQSESKSLLATNSNDPVALHTAGMALMRGGDPKRAAEAFGREYAVDSTATSIYNQACAFALARETAPALDALRRSIFTGYGESEKFRSDEDLASLKGNAEFRRLSDLADDLSMEMYSTDGFGDSRWKKQMPQLERAVREHADAGRAWWNLGFAQLRMGDPGASIESFARALGLGYRTSNTLYNMSCASAQRHDADAALAYLARAEKAGMDVGKTALDDHDLDPIRSDARFRETADRWRDERRAEVLDKFRGKSKHKDK